MWQQFVLFVLLLARRSWKMHSEVLTKAQTFAIFFGGTSLLIMVGVILDTLQQIESYLLSRRYDGLMKSGKMRGRPQSPVGGIAG